MPFEAMLNKQIVMSLIMWNVKVILNNHSCFLIISNSKIRVDPPSQMYQDCNLKIVPMLSLNLILLHEWVILNKINIGNKTIWWLICHTQLVLTILPSNNKIVNYKLLQFGPHEIQVFMTSTLDMFQTNHCFGFTCFCLSIKYLLETLPIQECLILWILIQRENFQ
jgi:hypothetical protein